MSMAAERTNSRHPHRRKTPSFSSSLLDSIFRSIDDPSTAGDLQHQYDHEYHDVDDDFFCHQQTTSVQLKQHRAMLQQRHDVKQELPSIGREIMMEKRTEDRRNRYFGSYWSSSGSSSGATFSSSSESEYIHSISTPTPSSNQLQHAIFPSPNEITTCFDQQTPKRGGKFMRTTRLRALKIYGDLKKVKQPISPGGRISNFLNSILGSRNMKKAKLDEAAALRKSRSVKDSTTTTTTTTCSSFSRSCLSKTLPPLPDSNTNNNSKRFDSRPREHNIYKMDPIGKNYSMGDDDLSVQSKNLFRNFLEDHDEEEDDNDDDDQSCASSDLFELEIVGGVGIGAYREELPVFGTTNLAIANGLIR